MRNESCVLLPLLEFFNFDDKRKTHTIHTNQTTAEIKKKLIEKRTSLIIIGIENTTQFSQFKAIVQMIKGRFQKGVYLWAYLMAPKFFQRYQKK